MNVGIIERAMPNVLNASIESKVNRRLKFNNSVAEIWSDGFAMPGEMPMPELREFFIQENGKYFNLRYNHFEENPVWKKYELSIEEHNINPLLMTLKQILRNGYIFDEDIADGNGYIGQLLYSEYNYEKGVYSRSGVLDKFAGQEVPAIQYRTEITFKNKKLHRLKVLNTAAMNMLIADVTVEYTKPTITLPTDWVWEDEA